MYYLARIRLQELHLRNMLGVFFCHRLCLKYQIRTRVVGKRNKRLAEKHGWPNYHSMFKGSNYIVQISIIFQLIDMNSSN